MIVATTVTAYLAAVESVMRAHFGAAISQYGIWQPLDERGEPDISLRTPAILLNLDRLDTSTDQHPPHTVRWDARAQALCLLSRDTANLQTELWELGAAVGGLVCTHDSTPMRPPLVGQRWGLGTAADAPDRAAISIAPVDLGLPGIAAVSVNWTQSFYLPEQLPET